MPTKEEWQLLIAEALKEHQPIFRATTYFEKQGTASKPIKVLANNDKVYLVKGRQNGRMIVNEQIVGVLGIELETPMAPIALIDVPQVLIEAEPEMKHMHPGVSHASEWCEGCIDRRGIAYTEVPENRSRFAALAVLYSWVFANDHQWIYQKAPPNLVFSVDHGHFFPGGPDWNVNKLNQAGDVNLDKVFKPCDLGPADFEPLKIKLDCFPPSAIAAAVARPPADWQITEEERIELAIYLDDRRLKLAALLATLRGG